jgi:hypothetical protein
MRNLLIVLSVLLLQLHVAHADFFDDFGDDNGDDYGVDTLVDTGTSIPGPSIGVFQPVYPMLAPVPGYPVYYDPMGTSNYFFYDGLYWVFAGDDWYLSSWYDGPWELVQREYVPVYILRVPVSYYRVPPSQFMGWIPNAPPHWGELWGPGWEQLRRGWNHWDHHSAPRPAPLPSYQRRYSGEHYPRGLEQQRSIQSKKYRYRPRDPESLEYFQQRRHPGLQNREREYNREDRGREERSLDRQRLQKQNDGQNPADFNRPVK